MDNQLILIIAAPIVTAIGAYVVAKRTTSGDIDTSDAATLWAESQAIRKELRDEIVSLRNEVKDLREKIQQLESERFVDKQKIEELVSQVRRLETRLKKLGGEI